MELKVFILLTEANLIELSKRESYRPVLNLLFFHFCGGLR
ncbi:hypothetical protein M7I_1928 [Glarea lozoyensis 74030]|uniref:Uncharacterized protein n=1 Tax=Glarea lozoyensis (strain ATCC 74030 / MF5533) TaxID=1104152 RepID=H0EHF0_GLAL7|nr:hypothetical protein M7I_1928 [Glarea lozoyensis 74030]